MRVPLHTVYKLTPIAFGKFWIFELVSVVNMCVLPYSGNNEVYFLGNSVRGICGKPRAQNFVIARSKSQ